jgi:hypothetical protein
VAANRILNPQEVVAVLGYLDAIGCGDKCPLQGFQGTDNCTGPNLLCDRFGKVTRLVLHDANLQGRAESHHLAGMIFDCFLLFWMCVIMSTFRFFFSFLFVVKQNFDFLIFVSLQNTQ